VLTSFLRDNADIFAWSPSDMPGVPRELAEHRLEVNKTAQPIKQKFRRFKKDRKQAIEVKICKLLDAGFIRECQHPVWLANPVLVPKKTGGLRMCIDYTDLNKHCRRIRSLFLVSTRSMTQQLVASYFASWTTTRDITR
jgi:hypothetical protein